MIVDGVGDYVKHQQLTDIDKKEISSFWLLRSTFVSTLNDGGIGSFAFTYSPY